MEPRAVRSRVPEHLARIGMSQAEFARRLKVSKAYITQIINLRKKFSIERGKMAANILGCYIDDLYEWMP